MSLLYRLSPNRIIIAAALFLVATANLTFFRAVLALYPLADNFGFVVSLAILLAACLTLLMSVFSLALPWRWTVSLFLLTAAASSYFSDQFGTIMAT
tara:strand:+ start:31242 stop:31532 length:291 start_codon:yes stop_codon:yes gene_type:complete